MTVSPAQVAEETVGGLIDPIKSESAHVDRHLRERHVCGYGPAGRRHSEIPKRMGNRRVALKLTTVVRQKKIADNAMIELKDVFLRLDLPHASLDPVNQEIAEPLRNEVADPHAPRLEKGSGGRPLRSPAVGHNLLRSFCNRRQKAMLAKQTKEASAVIHSVLGLVDGLGKFFDIDAPLGMKLLVDRLCHPLHLLVVVRIVPADGRSEEGRVG